MLSRWLPTWRWLTNEMGYLGAAGVFGGLLLLTALLYSFTSISRVTLFWAAFHPDSEILRFAQDDRTNVA